MQFLKALYILICLPQNVVLKLTFVQCFSLVMYSHGMNHDPSEADPLDNMKASIACSFLRSHTYNLALKNNVTILVL